PEPAEPVGVEGHHVPELLPIVVVPGLIERLEGPPTLLEVGQHGHPALVAVIERAVVANLGVDLGDLSLDLPQTLRVDQTLQVSGREARGATVSDAAEFGQHLDVESSQVAGHPPHVPVTPPSPAALDEAADAEGEVADGLQHPPAE